MSTDAKRQKRDDKKVWICKLISPRGIVINLIVYVLVAVKGEADAY